MKTGYHHTDAAKKAISDNIKARNASKPKPMAPATHAKHLRETEALTQAPGTTKASAFTEAAIETFHKEQRGLADKYNKEQQTAEVDVPVTRKTQMQPLREAQEAAAKCAAHFGKGNAFADCRKANTSLKAQVTKLKRQLADEKAAHASLKTTAEAAVGTITQANVVIETYEDILRFVTSYIDSHSTTVTDFVLCLCKNARLGADTVSQLAQQSTSADAPNSAPDQSTPNDSRLSDEVRAHRKTRAKMAKLIDAYADLQAASSKMKEEKQ